MAKSLPNGRLPGPSLTVASVLGYRGYGEETMRFAEHNSASHAMRPTRTAFPAILCAFLLSCLVPAHAETSGPRNLAPEADIAATSELNSEHAVRWAIDGQVPAAMSRADGGKAWAAAGTRPADLTLTWGQSVTVAEIVYYGRTACLWNENWKDYEIYVEVEKKIVSVDDLSLPEGDDEIPLDIGKELMGGLRRAAAKPVARGRFSMGHGPQRITLPEPVRTRAVRIRFLSSHGGPNPGAAEIQVYSVRPSADALGKFVPAPGAAPVRRTHAAIPESPALSARLKSGQLGFTRLLVVERNRIGSSHVYTYHCEGQSDGGGLYICDLSTGELTRLVDSSNGQILDCDLSYDGAEVLFSWRKGKYYQLYRIGVDGAGLTQLTNDEAFNFNACWLPDGGIGFLSSRKSQFAYCWTSPVGILHRMERDGSAAVRLSANYLNDFTPAVLSDGRIMYGRWEYVDRPAIPIQSLWTINPDGTGLAGFYGNRVLDPATFIEPQSIPGTAKILCTMTGHNGQCRGAIGIIDAIRGDNHQAAIHNITPEVKLRGVAISSNGPRGPYQNPYPLDDEYFLVSHNGNIVLRDYAGTERTLVVASRGMGFWNSRPLRPRTRPPVRSSGLLPVADGEVAGIFVQDVYTGLEPHVRRGEVAEICVVQEVEKSQFAHVARRAFGFQFPVVSCGATYAPKKVWGYATVRPDGSAFFQVPAGVPIYFMAVDAEGRAVQRMRSFTHLMAGEIQGCVGCHEPRTQTPRRPRPAAVSREPEALRLPEWGGPKGFDYASIVQPVLDRHCIECHNPRAAGGGIDLTGDRTDFFNVSYEILARDGFDGRWGGNRYTSSISSYNGSEANILEITPKKWGSPASKLADLILAGHPDGSGKARIAMDEAGRRRIFAWIDLNVPYYGTSRSNHYDLRGCRQIQPADLDNVLANVTGRRCVSCHGGGRIPRKQWVRITNPHLNNFLLAPLAKSAGGTERCGTVVFASTDDSDYQAILNTFRPIRKLLRENPRMDMIAAAPPRETAPFSDREITLPAAPRGPAGRRAAPVPSKPPPRKPPDPIKALEDLF